MPEAQKNVQFLRYESVYPIVNILTGIALIFGTGGSAMAAILIGA